MFFHGKKKMTVREVNVGQSKPQRRKIAPNFDQLCRIFDVWVVLRKLYSAYYLSQAK